MRRLHVLVRFRDRDVEVKIEGKDGTRDQHDEDGESGVLEVRDLDFHGSELNAPANIASSWRRLEADVLPVCRLQVLEMVGFSKVQLFEIFGEDDDGVPDEEVGKVSGEEGVHAAVHEMLLDIGINDEVWVEVFFA